MKIGILSFLAGIILASCSTSNDVVSGNGIQKRKYNEGYYISWGNKFKNSSSDLNSDQEVSGIKSEENSFIDNHTLAENVNSESENSLRFIDENTTDNFVLTNTEPIVQVKSDELSKPLEVSKPQIRESFKPGRVLTKSISLKKVSASGSAESGVMLVLLVILALILPPLAVFIFEGATSRFWIDLVLFIIGIAVIGVLGFGLSGLAMLVSIILALLIVLSII